LTCRQGHTMQTCGSEITSMADHTAPQSRLLRGATILTSDPAVADLLRGDLLVRDGRIDAVGEDLAVGADVEIVDRTGTIIFPGLVDAHQHVWEGQFLLSKPDMGIGAYFGEFIAKRSAAVTPDWLYEATRQALTSALRQGTTTTFDWCHAANSIDHAEAAIAAAVDSGTRGIVGIGSPHANGSESGHPAYLETLISRHGAQVSDRLTVAMAPRGPDQTPAEVVKGDIGRARALGIGMSMHVATRRAGPGGVRRLENAGLLGPDLQFVHLTDADDDELAMITAADAPVVIPTISELGMGIGGPPLRTLATIGARYGLGVDSVVGSPPDMFAQMRAAMLILRGGPWDGNDPPAGSRCAEVLAAATIGGARACWLGELTGSLTPGKAADLLVMRPTRPVTTIEQAYGQVVWMGDGSRLESVQIARSRDARGR
jgi:5-methylthioadenosine/S-adenosylhomocysteine deaminase